MNDDNHILLLYRTNALLGGTVGFAAVPWLLLALTEPHPLHAVAVVIAALFIFSAALLLTGYLVALWQSFHLSDWLWPIPVLLAFAPFIAAKELIATHPDLRYALVIIGEFDD